MACDRISQDLASPDLNRDFELVVIPDIYRHRQAENYQLAVEIINNFYIPITTAPTRPSQSQLAVISLLKVPCRYHLHEDLVATP